MVLKDYMAEVAVSQDILNMRLVALGDYIKPVLDNYLNLDISPYDIRSVEVTEEYVIIRMGYQDDYNSYKVPSPIFKADNPADAAKALCKG